MGKPKNKSTTVGRSIIRDRFGRTKRNQHGNKHCFIHTSEVDDGYDWGRLNLQSITEQSNLDDFLTTAEMAGTEFTAEKLNISFVDPQGSSGVLSQDEQKTVSAVQQEHKQLLCIPRRPPWDETTTPDQLDLQEREAFLTWRRDLSQLQEVDHIIMTPYEKNLDFWRQLWRVIERSDIIVQIVDGRNPLLFRSEDLEKYVKEVDDNKVNLLLVNKADYLTAEQREHWKEYFDSQNVRVAFWSALDEEAAQSAVDPEEEEEEDEFRLVGCNELNDNANAATAQTNISQNNSNQFSPETDALQKDLSQDCVCAKVSSTIGQADICDEDSSELSKDPSVDLANILDAKASISDSSPKEIPKRIETCSKNITNTAEILTGMELLDFFRSLYEGVTALEGVTTIGMVGYPNVGKSSTINAILKMKKVPVSATPGRTKHFQTLFVESDLMLCDCPGLVFPTFVNTKADLVTNGILPIDQLREHIPPVASVCSLIPRKVIEVTYSINLPYPDECVDENVKPSAHQLLAVYGRMRGFMTPKGIPDGPRSSRYILKDFVNGRLLYCHAPPGVSEDLFRCTPEPVPKVRKHASKTPKETDQVQTSLDKEFFSQAESKMHSKSIQGMSIRGVTLAVVPEETESAQSSQSALNEKPWRKHNNRNKKEKLRRLHSYKDY